MYDVVIVGAGPAGISAAIYVARKKLKLAVVTENIGGQTLLSGDIENYLGYHLVDGQELVTKFEEHLKGFPVTQEFSLAKSIEKKDRAFVVSTENDKEFATKTVIIATGKKPRQLDVPGEKELLGRGVTYCATCDGPVFTGMDVAVIGGGNSGLEAAEQLSRIAKKVYLVSRRPWKGDEVTQEKVKNAQNVTSHIGFNTIEIKGDKQVTTLVIEDKETKEMKKLSVQGVFIEVGSVPVTDFVKDFVELNEFKEIKVDSFCRTNISGAFAAGDVTDVPEKQIIIAAGEGAKAALSTYKYLLSSRD